MGFFLKKKNEETDKSEPRGSMTTELSGELFFRRRFFSSEI